MAFLTLTSCAEPKRIVQALPTPPERLVCVGTAQRPDIPREFVIDWANIRTVPEAKLAHEGYVRQIRTREGIITGYILQIERQLFTCSNNMQWRVEFEKRVNGN